MASGDSHPYIEDVKGAIDDAAVHDGGGKPDPLDLLANLAARGLLVVHVPPGVHYTFVGDVE